MLTETEINKKINVFKKNSNKKVYTISAFKKKGISSIKKLLINYVYK